MILLIHLNIPLTSLSISSLLIIDKDYEVNSEKLWKKLESGLKLRNKLEYKSDLIFKNKENIFHI